MAKWFEKSFIRIWKMKNKREKERKKEETLAAAVKQTNRWNNNNNKRIDEEEEKIIRKQYDKHTLNGLFIFFFLFHFFLWIENHFDSENNNFDASIWFFLFLKNLLAYTDLYQRRTGLINMKQRYE